MSFFNSLPFTPKKLTGIVTKSVKKVSPPRVIASAAKKIPRKSGIGGKIGGLVDTELNALRVRGRATANNLRSPRNALANAMWGGLPILTPTQAKISNKILKAKAQPTVSNMGGVTGQQYVEAEQAGVDTKLTRKIHATIPTIVLGSGAYGQAFKTGQNIYDLAGNVKTLQKLRKDKAASAADKAATAEAQADLERLSSELDQLQAAQTKAAGTVEKTGKPVGGNAVTFGAAGMIVGGPVGALIGAGIGLGIDYFKQNKAEA